MDAATLQAKLNAGYGKAALRLGYQFTVYRPSGAGNPIVPGNIIGSPLNAAFTAKATGYNFLQAPDYKQPLFLGLFDPTNTLIGDYLYNATHGTYFIASHMDQLPVLCAKCNNTISVLRAQGPTTVGVSGYIGAVATTEVSVITSWPAVVLYEARGRAVGAKLPMDELNPFFLIYVPALAGIDIRPSDIITDTNSPARRYVVAASERSSFGWRISAQHVVS